MEPALAEAQAKRARPCDEVQSIMVRMREVADDLVNNYGVCLDEDDRVLLLRINNPNALHMALSFAGSPVLPAPPGPDQIAQSVADFMAWFSNRAARSRLVAAKLIHATQPLAIATTSPMTRRLRLRQSCIVYING
mmetsp:Transcript_42247/g.96963  ORF Transcript_42247/g.96963 Transcript_42247/m.96963 type:complete len:136 (+) Transcript_42247:76-483(+)